MRPLLSRKALQVYKTNPKGEEVAEATKDRVAQAAEAVDTRARGEARIKALDPNQIQIDYRAIRLAITQRTE
jgi:hypothetical protein